MDDQSKAGVERAILQEYLQNQGLDPSVRGSIADSLEPFYRMAEKGKLALSSAEESSQRASSIKEILAQIWPVSRIVFVMRGQPLPKPVWMTDEVFQTKIWLAVVESVEHFLKEYLQRSFGRLVGDYLHKPKRGRLLFDALNQSLWHPFHLNCCGSMHHLLSQNYLDCFFYFLALHLNDQPQEAKKLHSLLGLMTSVLPLGNKKDEPGVWIAMVS